MSDAVPTRAALRNQLFARMRPEDWDLLAPHLEAITLKERQVVEVPGKPITHVHFIEVGVVSVVAVNAEDHRIEVGVIGDEGMTGVSLVMGDARAQHSSYMQIAGNGYRIPAAPFVEALKRSPSLSALMLQIRPGLHDPDRPYGAGQWPRPAGRKAGALALDGA